MPTYLENVTISIPKRQSLIQAFPCFSALTQKQSKDLAQLMRELSYSAGEVVVTQDEVIDSIYFIIKGEAEVTYLSEYKKKKILTPLAMLHAGESIGLSDTGFYSTTGKRTASVTASTKLLLLVLGLKELHAFLQKNKLESEMYAASEQMLRMQLIKQSLPFGKIPHERLQELCKAVEELKIKKGKIIFDQGDQGDQCYLIRSGKVEIIAKEKNGTTHLLSVLKPPALFGEATLITQEPRNARARALEDTQLLVISIKHLGELLEKEQKVAEMFITLMFDRSRPERNLKIVEYPRTTSDGQTVVILKNSDNNSYFKLSQEGWFIWRQMNGRQTLFEITMALANQYQVFSPSMVVALISKLSSSGFIANIKVGILRHDRKSIFEHWMAYLKNILEFRIIFTRADYWVSKLYDKGVKFVFTWVGQLLLASLGLFGFIIFLATENQVVHILRTLHASWFIFICMVPLTLLTVGLHELGHAFGTKAFGRQVHSIGVGWNWTSPIAFTDTTDMWLDSRWHRIAVNFAGLYTNILVAGFCSLLILYVPSVYMQAFLWLFALTTYIKGFSVLNPAQDMDGYYIMIDLFERQHLRQDATGWLIKKFPAVLKRPSLLHKYGPELGYWLACLIFLALTAIITLYVQGFILKLLGLQPLNVFMALIIPSITVVVSSLTLVSDIRKQD